jgi:SRSO17 transposase
VPLPAELKVKDPEPALPQFVNQSPWDEREVLNRSRAVLAETFADPKDLFVSDDPSFPKPGKPSVGVQQQYGGALGRRPTARAPSASTPSSRRATTR